MSKEWKTTVITVRDGKGEYGTFFVRESEVVARKDGNGFDASAEWTANTSFGLFGHYWSSMGQPFGEFISDISEDYLLSKIGKKVTDTEQTTKELKRLVLVERRENRITKDEAREALTDIEELACQYDGEVLCHMLYESRPLDKCNIEWCDLNTQVWDSCSLNFAKRLWPLFVKQFNEQCTKAEAQV
jgi:hypothetical protein